MLARHMRRRAESTYDSTPAAMILRVEAGIAILKPPAMGCKVDWVALSIVRYCAFVYWKEEFLIIARHKHYITKSGTRNTSRMEDPSVLACELEAR